MPHRPARFLHLSVGVRIRPAPGRRRPKAAVRASPSDSATGDAFEGFFSALSVAPSRVLLADYDGTLAPFRSGRGLATPYAGVSELLSEIAAGRRTRLVLVSGRAVSDLGQHVRWLRPRPELWGSHGLERMTSEGRLDAPPVSRAIADLLGDVARWMSARDADRLFEPKPYGFALHERTDPGRYRRLRDAALARWSAPACRAGLLLRPFDGGIEFRPAEAEQGPRRPDDPRRGGTGGRRRVPRRRRDGRGRLCGASRPRARGSRATAPPGEHGRGVASAARGAAGFPPSVAARRTRGAAAGAGCNREGSPMNLVVVSNRLPFTLTREDGALARRARKRRSRHGAPAGSRGPGRALDRLERRRRGRSAGRPRGAPSLRRTVRLRARARPADRE